MLFHANLPCYDIVSHIIDKVTAEKSEIYETGSQKLISFLNLLDVLQQHVALEGRSARGYSQITALGETACAK